MGGTNAGHASATETLRSVRDHSDLGAWMDAVAQVVSERTDGEIATSSSDSLVVEEDEPYTGSFGAAAPAADLDGDGRDDVLVYSYDLDNDRLLMDARSGSDAALRWDRAPAGDAAMAWSLGSDATGDGAADVFEMTLDVLDESYEWTCEDEESCYGETYSATFQWGLTLLSGADGAEVWSRTYDGDLVETYEERYQSRLRRVESAEYVYSLTGTAVDVLPFMADLAGDGNLEFTVNVLDVDVTEAGKGRGVYVGPAGAATGQGTFSLDATTVVELVDATTGATWRELTEDSPGMIALMYPFEQADGADLVWERAVVPDEDYRCVYAYAAVVGHGRCSGGDTAPSTSITVLDGMTTDPTWTADFEGWGYSYPVGGDLDADGLNDLVVYTEGDAFEATFVSNVGGAALWSAGLDFIAIGPLDDVPGDDLVTVAYSYDDGGNGPALPPYEEPSYDETLTLERRNGRTGEAFLSETRTGSSDGSESGFSFTFPYTVGGDDADGDGAPDITVGLITYTEEMTEDDFVFSVTAHDSLAQSGATAETLYEAPDGPVIYPTADLDGDGLAEIAQVDYTYDDRGQETATFTPISVPVGAPLWTSSATGAAVVFAAGGDFDGDGGADVLRHVDVVDARRVQTLITNLTGPAGAARWSFGTRP